jgi:hypothetical protein
MYGPSKATVSLVVVLLKRQATREAIFESLPSLEPEERDCTNETEENN